MAIQITDKNFNEIVASNKSVVVQFSAEWCGPCRILGPIIDQLAQENKDVIIGKLDVTDNPLTAAEHRISTIPTVLYFKNGQLAERTNGVMSKPAFQKIINGLKD